MAHIDNPLWLIWIMAKEGKSFNDAFEWVDNKIEKGWNLKIRLPEAKKLTKPKYEAARLLLDSSRRYLTKRER